MPSSTESAAPNQKHSKKAKQLQLPCQMRLQRGFERIRVGGGQQ